MTQQERALGWRQGRDTGASSIALWGVLMGTTSDGSTPWDVDDFGRCERLLKAVPEWRARLPEMAARFPIWTGLVREWPRLVELYHAHVAGPCYPDPSASVRWKAFGAVIDPLIDEGRIADGWVRTSPTSWHREARDA